MFVVGSADWLEFIRGCGWAIGVHGLQAEKIQSNNESVSICLTVRKGFVPVSLRQTLSIQ